MRFNQHQGSQLGVCLCDTMPRIATGDPIAASAEVLERAARSFANWNDYTRATPTIVIEFGNRGEAGQQPVDSPLGTAEPRVGLSASGHHQRRQLALGS